jgi:hypothetical protein
MPVAWHIRRYRSALTNETYKEFTPFHRRLLKGFALHSFTAALSVLEAEAARNSLPAVGIPGSEGPEAVYIS